ncbi:MAG: hypothetical protein A2015_00585 [Spirochaetes bacterium GWF1_31_7]|nr:MAG: hypothetical protein A2Y30_03925 [Spirochaetes bacterium GWE1_32_154]OHD45169.1 MAG: hypothetical protein A2Y29_15970 [Spirochaetes bacterium GWE2_31_10]OHD51079.1 MAG: hypothetical protein A2015_00585 [Spirochaetes bacterium GWF1_31_7]OHD80596.1 MAG: hypothetical protein A2355_07685 [Spirochaetes bacterium RIFOXYB1_FULL_32_8]HBD94804.1 hypothetical protein [Spirochaetia bacterium]
MISTILIIDDSDFQRKYLTSILKDKFSLYEASTIEDARNVYQSKKIDLIIVDNILEKSNGYQFTQMLRMDKEYGNIPVIMASAMDRPHDVQLGFESGINGYLFKPVNKERLFEMIFVLETDNKPKRKEKVLIIDDSKMIRSILKRAFEASGFTVTEAENGKEGYEAALRFKPDIITCDIEMPVMTGLEFVEAFRKHDEFSKIPVYMITTRIDDALREKAFKLGISEYIAKPFDPSEVTKIISKKLDVKYSMGKKPLILLADDSKAALHITEHTLLTNGYLVETVRTGLDALECIKKKKYDLIITDYYMPAMDGFTLISETKKIDINAKTPFIILSGADKKTTIMESFVHGAVDYVSKPFEENELIARITKILEL